MSSQSPSQTKGFWLPTVELEALEHPQPGCPEAKEEGFYKLLPARASNVALGNEVIMSSLGKHIILTSKFLQAAMKEA